VGALEQWWKANTPILVFSDFYRQTVDTNKKWSPVTTITLKKNL
jgi:hypothetical protein